MVPSKTSDDKKLVGEKQEKCCRNYSADTRTILLGAEMAPTAELLRHAQRNKVLLEFAERTYAAEIINAE